MKIQQILQKCLTDWKNISQLDFCLLDSDNHIFVSTCDKKLPAESETGRISPEQRPVRFQYQLLPV